MKLIDNLQKGLYKFIMGGKPMENQLYDKDVAEYNEQIENRIWYMGKSQLLENFYGQFVNSDIKFNYFWSRSYPYTHIRKMHSGLPAMMIDKLVQITVRDGYKITTDKAKEQELVDELIKENNFKELAKASTALALVNPDGAFKIDVDTEVSKLPIFTYVPSKNVEVEYKYNRLIAITFKSYYERGNKTYCLHERREKGIHYHTLYVVKNNELQLVDLNSIPETAELEPEQKLKNEILFAIPLKIYADSIFAQKKDIFDAIDETISIMGDSIRDSRTERYIPADKLPKDTRTGEYLMPDGMDSRYILTEPSGKDVDEKIQTVQPNIEFDGQSGVLKDYINQALLGVLSPSTLGIDNSNERNAEDRREAEKTSIFTRTDIIRTLEEAWKLLFEKGLQMIDEMAGRKAKEYEINVEFGEYASLSFENKIEALSKAKQFKILTNDLIVEELYGDTKSTEEKEEIVNQLSKMDNPITMDNLFQQE